MVPMACEPRNPKMPAQPKQVSMQSELVRAYSWADSSCLCGPGCVHNTD